MSAVWLRFRADVRRRGTALVLLGVLTGVAGGVVIVAVAGARRTSTTLARYVRASKQPDVLVNPDNLDITDPASLARWQQVDRLPNVVATSELRGVMAVPVGHDGQPDDRYFGTLIGTTAGGRDWRDVDRAHVVAGRLPDQSNAHEVLINRELARRFRLHVGSRLRIFTPEASTFADVEHLDPKTVRIVPVTVVGIMLPLDDAVRPADDPRLSGALLLTQAFGRLPHVLPLFEGKSVRLEHGRADLPAFEAAASRLLRGNVNYQETRSTEARATRAVRPFVVALWLFAALAALASGVIVGQALARQHRADSGDDGVLRAIGWARRDVVALALLRGAFIGVFGAVVAVTAAWAASSIMPIGPLRVLEPSPGRSIDVVAFTVGAAGIVAIAMGHALLVALTAPARASRRARTDIPARLPVPVATGVRFALDRARGTLPVRSTLVGVCVAVAALVASMVYGSALQHFTSTPRLYGWVWDYQVEVATPHQLKPVARALRHDDAVEAFTTGQYAQLDFGTQSVAAIAVQPKKGVPMIETVAGRAPAGPSEVALGAATMRALHAHIGGTVSVRGVHGRRSFTVVGRAVFARFAPYSGSDPTGLGTGAVVTPGALRRLTANGAGNGNHFFLVVQRRGAHIDPKEMSARLSRPYPSDAPITVWAAQRPNDVLSYERLERTPLLLAGLLVLLGAATLTHLLVSGVRRRRRDLGLLKAVGCTVRQVVTVVLTQATTLVALALVVAIPAGIVAGRTAWTVTADWLGVPARPVVPVTVIALVVGTTLLVANAVAFLPGRHAGRVRPALALRTE